VNLKIILEMGKEYISGKMEKNNSDIKIITMQMD